MIIAIYLRVSKDKKGGVSIDVQRKTCMRWIAHHADPAIRNAQTVEYVDQGKSAHTEDWSKRPQFLRLMTDAKARAFDLVLVYMFDRFSRKTILSLQAMSMLVEAGVAFYSASEHIDYNTPHGRKNVRDLASSAEFYSDLLGQRMRDVRYHEARQGLHIGPIPVGYNRCKGALSPNEEAEGVRELGRLYASGHYSAVRLAEALNRRGYTIHGQRWTDSAIKEIVRSPVFAGYVTHKGEVLPGVHEALWSTDLWEQIQRVNAERWAYYPGGGSTKHYALLTGVARCAQCGGTMVYALRPDGRNRYYRCRTANRRLVTPYGMTCAARKGYAPELEAGALAWLAGLAALPDLLDDARQMLAGDPPTTGPNRTEVEDRLRRLARAFGDGAYSDDEYFAKRAALLAQLEQTPASVPAIDVEAGIALIRDIPSLLAKADPCDGQAIVRQLFSAIYVYRYEIYAIRPTVNAALFFEAIDSDEWLKATQNEARCAPGFFSHHSLKRAPLILKAA